MPQSDERNFKLGHHQELSCGESFFILASMMFCSLVALLVGISIGRESRK